ncbi:MAG: AAA family ATPase [Candidatus Omnitrophica bacterium]|nr:AAA family ATPase [Candidatus Omnitrophota bacterium]
MIKIGIAGKGGTGKTTLSALIILTLLRGGKTPILAVDADPDSNLNETLGIKAPEDLVSIVNNVEKMKHTLPAGMDKIQYLEFRIREAISENKGFDMLLMGRTEGPGCYCYANNLLRDLLDKLEKNYSFIVMDSEAGFEHISRRTTRSLDILFITALCNKISLRSAEKIYQMSKNIELDIKNTYLVLNEFRKSSPEENPPSYFLNPCFTMPFDSEILHRSYEGKGILDIPDQSLAYNTVQEKLLSLLNMS